MKESDCIYAYDCGLTNRCKGCEDYRSGISDTSDPPSVMPPLSECPICHTWHGGKGVCAICKVRARIAVA